MFYLFRWFIVYCLSYPVWFLVLDVALSTLLLLFVTVAITQGIKRQRKGVKKREVQQPKEPQPPMA